MEKVILHTSPEEYLVEKIAKRVFELLKSDTQQNTTKETPDEEYLTSKQVMKILKISPTTLWNWVNKGKVNQYGTGGKRYFKKSEIDNFLIKTN